MTRITIILTILTLLSSCTSNYLISIQHDGSATVNVDRNANSSDIDRYIQSDIISNLDTNGVQVSFDISNIDSLGKYLPFHPKGFWTFSVDNNELTIIDGNKDSMETNEEFCCHLNMVIEFDRNIQEIISTNRKSKQIEPKKVQIRKTRRQLMKGKNGTDLKIKLETTGGNST